jgi:hypothetical protein
MNGLNFDPWQFAGSKSRPVSAETQISWSDFSLSMSVHSRKQVQERRLPVPAWALSDTLLRSLLVVYAEQRTTYFGHVRKTDGKTLIERRVDAEKRLQARIPSWNATIDKLQLEYVAAQKDGTPKARLDRLEEQIENLDTLIRITRKGTSAFLAAIVVLYYRMGKNSVEVGEEVGAKPPHVRQTLFRLHELWREKFQIDFMLEPAKEPVAPCRSYTQDQINAMLADGRIAIPKDKPKWIPPPAQPCDLVPKRTYPRAQRGKIDVKRAVELRSQGLKWKEVTKELGWKNQSSVYNAVVAAGLFVKRSKPASTSALALRRAARLKAGMCGTCGKRPRDGEYTECVECRKYYGQKSKEYQRRKAAQSAGRPDNVENANQEHVPENFEQAQLALCNA